MGTLNIIVGLSVAALTCLLPFVAIGCLVFGIIQVTSKEVSGSNDKIIWLLIVIFVPIIGPAIYYFVRRPARIRTIGR